MVPPQGAAQELARDAGTPGRLVKVASDLYFDRGALESARARLMEHLQDQSRDHRGADIATCSERRARFAIALLDYFDHSGVTTRVGDTRRLRTKAV